MNSEYIEPKEGDGCIYKITNLINGKVYIGQTINFKKRISDYKCLCCKGQTKLYRAIKKYGWDNFKIEQIAFGRTGEDLDKIEIYNIASYDSVKSGYNIQIGGIKNSNSGMVTSEDTKLKISKSLKGRKFSDEHRQKLREASIGQKHSEESVNRQRLKLIGKTHSYATKKKMSEAHMGNQYSLGRKLSDEHKRKIGDANKNWTEARRKKFSEYQKAKTNSPETIAKMKQSQSNRPIVKCNICGKEGTVNNMKRWHFDNCKLKPLINFDIKDTNNEQ